MTDRRRPMAVRQGAQARRREPEPEERSGFRISPTAVLLGVALVFSLLYIFYALTNRDVSQIPLLASGAVVLGLVFVAVAVVGLLATWRSSVGGRDGRAIAHALVGGGACLAAAGCFAVAVILAMVSGG
jgi:uncharacterized integral membrane protein